GNSPVGRIAGISVVASIGVAGYSAAGRTGGWAGNSPEDRPGRPATGYSPVVGCPRRCTGTPPVAGAPGYGAAGRAVVPVAGGPASIGCGRGRSQLAGRLESASVVSTTATPLSRSAM